VAQVLVFLPLSGSPSDPIARFAGEPTWLPNTDRLHDGRWSTTLHFGGFRRTVAVRLMWNGLSS